MSTKYEIRRNDCQVRKESETEEGCTLQQRDQEPEIMKSYDTLAEAKEALKKYKGSVEYIRDTVSFFQVVEYYIEQNEYDEDGEWVSGGDVWDFAPRDIN